MLIVYVAVVLLALAVCVLYAMVGELAQRVLAPDELGRPVQMPELKVVEGINLNTDVATIPPPIGSAAVDKAEVPADFGLVVLTTICTSCHVFARRLSGSPKAANLPKPLFVLISAPASVEAEKFVADTGLGALPNLTLLFDQMGRWCQQSIGLNVAPSFLRVIGGQLRGAWSLSDFTDIPVLWEPKLQRRASTAPKAA